MTELALKLGDKTAFATSGNHESHGLAPASAAATAKGTAHQPAAASTSAAALELRNVCLSYGHGARRNDILKDVNLTVAKGEFVAIVGFSGSGKTTLVSLLAGLAKADSGQVLTNGLPVTGPGPDRGIVFQSYSLMPWLTVRENVALAVDRVFPHLSASERADKTAHYVSMVGLTPAIDKKPAQLSGGMRQRVSVARALATNPEVLLMDEPLSALDALTRSQLQDEIVNIWDQDKKTVLLITNDVDEALIMADRVIPLTLGPGATLGKAFDVNIARPRDRLEMNHDKTFQELRAEITSVLMGMSSARKGQDMGMAIELPTIRPRDVSIKHSPSLPAMLGMRHAPLADQIDRDASEHAAQMALPIAANAAHAATSAVAPKPGDDRYVEFSQVVKVYPTPKGPQTVVDGFDIKIKKGEFISLIGHSGCGKSTVLSMVAGLTDITSGVAVLDGREVKDAGPDRGIVFQSPSLIPWLTAWDNVMIGVDRVYPHATAAERADMVGHYLHRVGLGDAMKKRASELSNGMKQRVGIARAFALSPKLLLLDEPFGMLDALTRWDLQEVLMEVWAREKVTAIMVTHDVDEAILLADRVVMMSNGPNAKIGHIMDVTLERPRTRKALLAHPRYYSLREELIGFLASCGHQH